MRFADKLHQQLTQGTCVPGNLQARAGTGSSLACLSQLGKPAWARLGRKLGHPDVYSVRGRDRIPGWQACTALVSLSKICLGHNHIHAWEGAAFQVGLPGAFWGACTGYAGAGAGAVMEKAANIGPGAGA